MDNDDSVPVLEIPCPFCEGKGGRKHYDHYFETCAACDGSGFQPTALGSKIINLMKHNFRPIYKELIEE
jgi:Tryptophan RNA-binding attenuator protein inhibitory protein